MFVEQLIYLLHKAIKDWNEHINKSDHPYISDGICGAGFFVNPKLKLMFIYCANTDARTRGVVMYECTIGISDEGWTIFRIFQHSADNRPCLGFCKLFRDWVSVRRK